jgi:hypothetical protein
VKLIDLEPTFLQIVGPGRRLRIDTLPADGLMFLCPKCFLANKGNVGTHSVCCWQPHVPQTELPTPGRWSLVGTGYHDLTLVAGSSSILLTSGCHAHFFIRNGLIEWS